MNSTSLQKRVDLLLSIFEETIEVYERKNNIKLNFDETIVNNIVRLYQNQLEKDLKKNLVEIEGAEKKVNIFKIISLTEFCIMYFQPLRNPSLKKEIELEYNARLCYDTARSLLKIWVDDQGINIDGSNLPPESIQELSSFKTNHIKWLARINLKAISFFPVYPNSLSWSLFFFILSDCKSLSQSLVRNES